MQRKLAAIVQLLGLAIVALGLIHGLVTGDIRTELLTLASGGLTFLLGWLVARERA